MRLDPKIKPRLWNIKPSIIAYNASMKGLPLPTGLWVWPEKNWCDLSGRNRVGTITNGDVRAGNLYLSGAGSSISIPNSDGLFDNDNFSMFIKFTIHSAANNDRIFTTKTVYNGVGWFLTFKTSGMEVSGNSGTYRALSVPWAVNETMTLVITRAVNGGVIGYKNGKYVATSDAIQNITTAASPLFLGHYASGGNEPEITVHAFSYFKQVLLPPQIATLYTDPYGLVRQPNMEELWAYVAAGGVTMPIFMSNYLRQMGA